MGIVVKPYTFSAGATIVASEHNSNTDTIYNEFNGSITNANIANNASIADTKLAQIATAGKVSGVSFTNLGSTNTATAGIIPAANIDTRTTGGKIIALNSAGLLPAVDGSQLTNINNKVVQVLHFPFANLASGNTAIPFDDSIPLVTEGDEYMTASITPTDTDNQLLIESVANFSVSNGGVVTMALFQDATTGSLCISYKNGVTSTIDTIPFSYMMTAGTVASTTFKIRIGNQYTDVSTFNGASSARKGGGKCISSITISEIKV